MDIEKSILSDVVVFMKYARHLDYLARRETWEEIVDRDKNMHIKRFPQHRELIEAAFGYVYRKEVMPSMRSLQFAGRPIELNPVRQYNCSYAPIDCLEVFAEAFFILLSGCGFGYSVQRHHVEKLPEIRIPTKERRYLIADNIEGWSDAVKVLIKSYFTGRPRPVFDFSDIREKGAMLVTSGGKAPGPEPLKTCLFQIQTILDRKANGEQLTTLECHDIVCHIADAVMAGGIRRASCIALFDIDDELMLTCKFDNWWELNPQRGRANNSAIVIRHKISEERFNTLWGMVQASGCGEPGFVMSNDRDMGTNPCGEVALRAYSSDSNGGGGGQFCNLTSINTTTIESQQDFNDRAWAASVIGTLQASYTNFHYLRDGWKRMTEKEALIGVSLAGIASGNILDLNIAEAAKVVVDTNALVAKLLGINPAARCTVQKPDGDTSLVLGSSSGVHAWHDEYYIRRLRVGKNESIYQYLATMHPELVVDEFFKPQTQAVIEVPQKAPDGAILRTESALELLNRIKKIYREWIVPGHRTGSNTNNVSATVSIKDGEWAIVGDWMWNNRTDYTALSVLPFDDHSYTQAPFESITKEQYEAKIQHLHAVDLTKVTEFNDETSFKATAACAGGACEIF